YESMIDRQLNKAMTQLQKLQANPQQAFPPYQGPTLGGCTKNPHAPKEPICDPSDPSSSTISCSPAQLSRPQGAPNEPISGGMGKPSLPVTGAPSPPRRGWGTETIPQTNPTQAHGLRFVGHHPHQIPPRQRNPFVIHLTHKALLLKSLAPKGRCRNLKNKNS
ncbi:MAG: hypothetical protein ACYTF1_22375, partial [Planctomycetota bacterium]